MLDEIPAYHDPQAFLFALDHLPSLNLRPQSDFVMCTMVNNRTAEQQLYWHAH